MFCVKYPTFYRNITRNKSWLEIILFCQAFTCLLQIYLLDSYQVTYNFDKIIETKRDSFLKLEESCRQEEIKPPKLALMIIGLIQLWIFHKSSKNAEQTELLLDASAHVIPWVMFSVMFVNPFRLTINIEYHSYFDLIFCPIKMALIVFSFILGLPFSLYTNSTFPDIEISSGKLTKKDLTATIEKDEIPDVVIGCVQNHHIDFNWCVMLPIILYMFVLMSLRHIQKPKRLTVMEQTVKTKKEVKDAVDVIQAGRVGEISTKFERNTQVNKEFKLATEATKESNNNVSGLRNQNNNIGNMLSDGPTKGFSVLTSREKIVLDSPTNSKPVNILKPLTFAPDQQSQRKTNHTKLIQTENQNNFSREDFQENGGLKECSKKDAVSGKLPILFQNTSVQTEITKTDCGVQVQNSFLLPISKLNKEIQFGGKRRDINKFTQTTRSPTKIVACKNIQTNDVKILDTSKSSQKCFRSKASQTNNIQAGVFQEDKKIQTNIKENKEINIKDKQTQTIYFSKQTKLTPPNHENLDKTVHFTTTVSDEVAAKTEPIRFKACKSQHGIWYVSLRGDIFLTVSQNILHVAKADENMKVAVADDILKTMKTFVDNYKKLSDCFDDEDESEDESFINGFRL